MINTRNKIHLLALLLLLTGNIFAQKVKIKVDAPTQVWVGEEFRLNYIVESDEEVDGNLNVADFKGLSVIYGPSKSYSSSITNKSGKREATYSLNVLYVLQGDKEGKYTLPRAEFTVDGKKYKSETPAIQVKSLAKNKEEGVAFVRTIISRTSVSPSDTLMLTYRLYTTMDIRQIVKTDFPRIDGFYSNAITRSRQTFQKEEYEGKTYNVVDLRKMILQPRDIGLKVIPSGSVTIEFGIPTGRKLKDRWGDTYNEILKKVETLPIEEAKISVQQLIEI